MKNALKDYSSISEQTEKRISELEDRAFENIK